MNKNYILYVDDSEDDTLMARRAFKKNNLTTTIVTLTDGQECLDYLFSEGEFSDQESVLPLVLLLDLNMPRVDGFEVLQQLKQCEKTKRLPVVVLTTSDAKNDIAKAYELGTNSYITKPLKTEDFLKMIADLDMYWSVHNQNSDS